MESVGGPGKTGQVSGSHKVDNNQLPTLGEGVSPQQTVNLSKALGEMPNLVSYNVGREASATKPIPQQTNAPSEKPTIKNAGAGTNVQTNPSDVTNVGDGVNVQTNTGHVTDVIAEKIDVSGDVTNVVSESTVVQTNPSDGTDGGGDLSVAKEVKPHITAVNVKALDSVQNAIPLDEGKGPESLTNDQTPIAKLAETLKPIAEFITSVIDFFDDEETQAFIQKEFETIQAQVSGLANEAADQAMKLGESLMTYVNEKLTFADEAVNALLTGDANISEDLEQFVVNENGKWKVDDEKIKQSDPLYPVFELIATTIENITRETVQGEISLAPELQDQIEPFVQDNQGEEGVTDLKLLKLKEINAYPTQIEYFLNQDESAEDKLQTLASSAKNLLVAATVIRTTWKDQAENADDPYNKFLETALPKLESLINKLPDLDSLNDSEGLEIEKELYTLKEWFEEVVEMLNKKDSFGNEKNTDLKPFFESAMQTGLTLISGAYGAIHSSGSIDEASQHFDNRQAVLDASYFLDPVFDNLNTLLEVNGFSGVFIKDENNIFPQPIEVKGVDADNEPITLADFLQKSNISQFAFMAFREACNDLQELKGKLKFSDSEKSKLARIQTEVEQLNRNRNTDTSIRSNVDKALEAKAQVLAELPAASFTLMTLEEVQFMFENSSDECVEWRQGVLQELAIPEGFGRDQDVTNQYLNDPKIIYLNDLAQDYKRLTPELYVDFLDSGFAMTVLFLDPEEARQANNPSLETVIKAAKSALNELQDQN